MITYHLSYDNPLTHVLHITITIPQNTQQQIYLQLPAWRPGRYELQQFAQKLYPVTATGDKQPIAVSKITKDKWVLQTNGAETIEVKYSFYAYQMDGGGSWLDEEQLYLNPINCLMAVEGREQETCKLKVAIPEKWQIACGLPKERDHTLLAENYDELVDSPFIASGSLEKRTFEVNNIPFHIWLQGNCQPDWEKIIPDFEAFTKEQLAVFKDFPVTDYHYLIQILPYRFYHGVEHANSTVITLGPSELLMAPSLYKELLGVSSRELLHTWNIKKIRPKEMLRYNYASENYFRTGYIAEGITTYYGDYILARAGVFTTAQYFEELNTTLQRYFADNGHQSLSIADSSFDLWLDGYKPGIPDRKVSIYIKGALTALLLDLQLRQTTANTASLDTVMQALWEEFGKKEIGYTAEAYENLVENIAGKSFGSYFDNYINGTTPIEPALAEALRFVGCTLKITENPLVHEGKYGFKITSDQSIKVAALMPGSPASMVLSIDDELIALNGRKLENNLQQLLSLQASQTELTVFRNKTLRTVILQADGKNYYSKYTIEKNPDASETEKQNFKLWLKQDF